MEEEWEGGEKIKEKKWRGNEERDHRALFVCS